MTALVLIWGPLYGFLTIVVVVALNKLAKRKWPSGIALALAIGWPVVDLAQTQLVLAKYCDEYGAGRVFHTAENLKGIYIAEGKGCELSCRAALWARDGSAYNFVEARAATFQDTRQKTADEQYEGAFVPGPGLYRFTLEKAGHPNCAIYDQWFAKRKGLHSNPHYSGICIATFPINQISSRYEIKRSNEVKTFGAFRLDETVYAARRIADNALLFERRHYVLWSDMLWSRFFNPFTCGRVEKLLTYQDSLFPSSTPSPN